MKLLVDANFLIDYYARRDEFFDSCTTLLVAESFHDVELWAPAKSFTDVFYVLNQRLKVEGSLVQRAFLKSFDFIKLVSLEPADVKEAARRSWDDFEDCLVAVAAEKIGALVGRDAAQPRLFLSRAMQRGFLNQKSRLWMPMHFWDG